jgi:hypothetical protein
MTCEGLTVCWKMFGQVVVLLVFASGCAGSGGADAIASGGACPPGFRDDDGDPRNGCETRCTPLVLNASGSRNFDVAPIRVSGRVTLAGQTAPTGRSRGEVVFVRSGSSSAVRVPLQATGEATYATSLFPGHYDIAYAKDVDCVNEAELPCGSMIARSQFNLAADEVLDINIARVAVSGEITVNGRAMPNGADGYLVFRPASATRNTAYVASARIPFSAWGRATYRVSLVPGDYDILVDKPTQCGASLPCAATVVRRSQSIPASGVLNLDLAVATISGSITLHARPVPNVRDGSARGSIAFVDADGYGPRKELSPTGPATYSLMVFKGTYSVVVDNQRGSCDIGPLPCGPITARTNVAIETTSALDIDLATTTVSGTVTINGRAMENGSARGEIVFSGPTTVSSALGGTGPATYSMLLYPGTYDVTFQAAADGESCRRAPAPCQELRLRTGVAIAGAGPASLNLDLPVIEVTGIVTVNQARLAASATGTSRGRLYFDETTSLSTPTSRRGTALLAGDGAYRVRLFPGTYRVSFENLVDCPASDVGALPCQSEVAIAENIALIASATRDFDLTVVDLSGVVTVQRRVLPDSRPVGAPGELWLSPVNGRSVMKVNLGASGVGAFQTRLAAGSYDVAFANTQDCPGGALPCQTLSLLGCRIW